jgi:hypothetical protein
MERLRAWQDRMDDRFGGVEFRFHPLPWDWRLSWRYDGESERFWWIDAGPFTMLLALRY